MRSSIGGCVMNSRLNQESLPSSSVTAVGSSIQRWAVAREWACDDRVVVPQLLQGGDEPGRVARHLDGGDVGQRLPPAADRELHDPGDERRQQQEAEPEQGERAGTRRPAGRMSL